MAPHKEKGLGVHEKTSGTAENPPEDAKSRRPDQTDFHETRFAQTLLNLNPDAIYLYDLVERRNIFANDSLAKILGYSLADLRIMEGAVLARLMHPDDYSVYTQIVLPNYAAVADGEIVQHRYRMKHGDGLWHWVESREIIYERSANGSPKRLFGVMRDVTGQVNAEQALRASEARLRELYERSPLGYQSLDAEGRFITVNQTWLDTLGYSREDVIGRWFGDFLPAESRAMFQPCFSAFIAAGEAHNEFEMVRGDGRIIPIGFDGKIGYDERGQFKQTHCILRDLSREKKAEADRQKLEVQAQQMQKLESLGILAGGIAHDFNNLLLGLYGYLERARLLANERQYAAIGPALAQAEASYDRARNLTQQLLTFAKGGAPAKKATDIAVLLRDTAAFSLSGSATAVEFVLPSDLLPCEVDVSQIQQAVDNILRNANDALPGGGRVTISAENCPSGEVLPEALEPGRYVRIIIRDNGPGISGDNLSRIFDPFFTTKTKGHGLGLTMVYSILRKHGGLVEAESAPGQGTAFILYLPASEALPEANAEKPPVAPSGGGRILVMDDEPVLAELIGEMLHELEFSVDLAATGEEAIQKYHHALGSPEPYRAVILDLTVRGGMGGKEAMTELRRLDPAICAIVSSGYANDPVLAAPEQFGFQATLPKPFRFDDVARVLAAAFSRKKSHGPDDAPPSC